MSTSKFTVKALKLAVAVLSIATIVVFSIWAYVFVDTYIRPSQYPLDFLFVSILWCAIVTLPIYVMVKLFVVGRGSH